MKLLPGIHTHTHTHTHTRSNNDNIDKVSTTRHEIVIGRGGGREGGSRFYLATFCVNPPKMWLVAINQLFKKGLLLFVRWHNVFVKNFLDLLSFKFCVQKKKKENFNLLTQLMHRLIKSSRDYSSQCCRKYKRGELFPYQSFKKLDFFTFFHLKNQLWERV